MLITIEPHDILQSNFAYLYILTSICLLDSRILSKLISGIIVSAFPEAINFINQAIYNLKPRL